MTTSGEAGSSGVGFGSLVELQQANLELLEEKASLATSIGAGSQTEKIRQFIDKAVATGAVLQRSSDRKAAQASIEYWITSLILSREYSTIETGKGQEPAADASLTLAELAPYDPGRASADIDTESKASPYKGLDPFTPDDAANYFGREDAVEELLKRIEGDKSIVVLLGPSGSGKSSLINAGLLPRLKDKGHKVVAVAAPGREPLAAILRAIKPGADMPAIRSDERMITRVPKRLNDVLSAVYPKAILVLDQFGEAMARTDLQPSLNIVGRALASLAGTHKLLICIRESQRLQFENIEGIGVAVRSPANCFSPPPPSVYELRSMIEGPAEHVGLRFGEGVVEDLVRSVAGNPDALPLLQFTLNKLWDNKDHNLITQEVYRKVGAPREALTGTAEAVFQKLSPSEKELAQRIFLKLVTPAGEKDLVRNRVGRDALSIDEAGETVDRILAAFEQARLLRRIPAAEIGGEDRFEAAHETLIAYWPTLATWLAEARQGRETEAKLIATARLWLDSGRDRGYLITGDALDKYKNYRSQSAEVNQLLDASFKARERDKRFKIGIVVCAAAIVGLVIYWRFHATAQFEREVTEAKKKAELIGEVQARADNLAKLNSIKEAVVAGNQQQLRAGLQALNIPYDVVNRVTTSPAANQADTAIQTVAPVAAPTPTPLPDKPIPPPQPQFDPETGDCFGYMWVGSKTNWKLRSPDGPDRLRPGPAVTNDSIYLRADFPTNPPEYAMAVPFGYVPTGTSVKVLQIKPFQRDSGVQYWIKVAVPRKSCAKVSIQYAGPDDLASQLRKLLTDANFQLAFAPEKLDRAAGLSEIRYFFKEDAGLAQAVADKVKEVNGGKPVTLRPLLNFDTAKPLVPGSLEAWVDLSPPPPK